MSELRNTKNTPRGRIFLCSLLPRTIKYHRFTLQRPDTKRSMGEGPAGPFPTCLGASILTSPWKRSHPVGEEGSRHTEWDGMGFILHRHAQIPLPAALSTPALGGSRAGTPPTPLGSPGYRRTSISQSEDAQGWGKKGSDDLINPPQPVVPHESDAVLSRTRGTSSPPRASGRIFPSLPRLPGIPITQTHRSEPTPCRGEMPDPLFSGLSGRDLLPREWPRAGAMPKAVFSRPDQGVCFAGNGETADGRAPGERGFSPRRCPHSHFRHRLIALIRKIIIMIIFKNSQNVEIKPLSPFSTCRARQDIDAKGVGCTGGGPSWGDRGVSPCPQFAPPMPTLPGSRQAGNAPALPCAPPTPPASQKHRGFASHPSSFAQHPPTRNPALDTRARGTRGGRGGTGGPPAADSPWGGAGGPGRRRMREVGEGCGAGPEGRAGGGHACAQRGMGGGGRRRRKEGGREGKSIPGAEGTRSLIPGTGGQQHPLRALRTPKNRGAGGNPLPRQPRQNWLTANFEG